jgi:hypothetical protein
MTNIDHLIAGADPLSGTFPRVDSSEADAIFERVVSASNCVPTRRGTRRRIFAGTGIVAIATTVATVVAATLTGVGTVVPSAAAAELTKLATAAASVPAFTGRYVVLSETDTQAGLGGAFDRTNVIDTQTGASITYQYGVAVSGVAPDASYTGAPADLAGPADSTSTEAWFAAMPTDPTALSAQLLTIAQQQQAQIDEQESAVRGKLTTGKSLDTQPTLSNDDLIYQEADNLLWSPLVQPALRSALYKVLATMSGFTVNDNAVDPLGRSAIEMTRVYSSINETDITYEDPTTGAVLAQEWNGLGGNLTALYQPATSSNAFPTDPYPN